MEGGLLLNVVVRKSAAVFELLARKDQALLVGRDAAGSRSARWPPLPSQISCYLPLLVLDLGLDIVDGVGGLDLKGDGLAREGLDEDLHLEVAGNVSYGARSSELATHLADASVCPTS